VLNSFSGAQDVHTIDETVLAEAASWIVDHQKDDGSWEPVGFIHHKEMIGGMSGNFRADRICHDSARRVRLGRPAGPR